MSVDTSVFRAGVRRMRAARPAARRSAVDLMTDRFTVEVARISPRSTNRYVRGWMLAAADVGSRPLPVPALQRDRNRERIEQRLNYEESYWRGQVRYWTTRKSQYERSGRTAEPYYRTITRQLRNATKRVEQAQRVLEEFLADTEGVALAVYRSRGKKGNSLGVSLRTKIYGGTGRVVGSGRETVVELTNLEPHWRIVEKNHRVLFRAVGAIRRFGGRKVSRKYLESVAHAAGRGALEVAERT